MSVCGTIVWKNSCSFLSPTVKQRDDSQKIWQPSLYSAHYIGKCSIPVTETWAVRLLNSRCSSFSVVIPVFCPTLTSALKQCFRRLWGQIQALLQIKPVEPLAVYWFVFIVHLCLILYVEEYKLFWKKSIKETHSPHPYRQSTLLRFGTSALIKPLKLALL